MLTSLICFQKLFASALKTYTNILIDVYLIVSTIVHKTTSVFKYFRFEYRGLQRSGLDQSRLFLHNRGFAQSKCIRNMSDHFYGNLKTDILLYSPQTKEPPLIHQEVCRPIEWLVVSAPFSARFIKSDPGETFLTCNDFGWFDGIREGGQHCTVGFTVAHNSSLWCSL